MHAVRYLSVLAGNRDVVNRHKNGEVEMGENPILDRSMRLRRAVVRLGLVHHGCREQLSRKRVKSSGLNDVEVKARLTFSV